MIALPSNATRNAPKDYTIGIYDIRYEEGAWRVFGQGWYRSDPCGAFRTLREAVKFVTGEDWSAA